MPLYDYRCAAGHLFEAFAQPQEEKLRCRHCRRKATRVWVSPQTFRREAQPFIPPVIFKASGKGTTAAPFLFPGRTDEATPDGYERVELRTVAEVRKFEVEYNELGKRVHAASLELEQARHDQRSRQVRSQLEKAAKQGPPNLRGYAERALERMGRRDFSGEAAKFSPGFSVEAFSFDASNRVRCDDPRSMNGRARR